MPDIKIKGYSGEEKTYQNVEKVYFSAAEGDQKVPYTHGEAVSKTVEPDFAGGDMAVEIPEGELVTELTIQKPMTLVPENIAQGVDVAGIVGAFVGSGGSDVAEMPKLKYIIPITQTAGWDSDYNLTLGTVTIQRSLTEDVRVILFRGDPGRLWNNDNKTVSTIEYEVVLNDFTSKMNTRCYFLYMLPSGGYVDPRVSCTGAETNAVSVSLTPYVSGGITNSLGNTGTYIGFILVSDSEFSGTATLIHENNYVSSTLGITVL